MELTKITFKIYKNTYIYSNDNKLFGGSVFQKLSDQLDLGLQVSWSSDNNDSSLAIGTQYQLNKDVKLRGKINNKSQLCLGSGIKIKDGKCSQRVGIAHE